MSLAATVGARKLSIDICFAKLNGDCLICTQVRPVMFSMRFAINSSSFWLISVRWYAMLSPTSLMFWMTVYSINSSTDSFSLIYVQFGSLFFNNSLDLLIFFQFSSMRLARIVVNKQFRGDGRAGISLIPNPCWMQSKRSHTMWCVGFSIFTVSKLDRVTLRSLSYSSSTSLELLSDFSTCFIVDNASIFPNDIPQIVYLPLAQNRYSFSLQSLQYHLFFSQDTTLQTLPSQISRSAYRSDGKGGIPKTWAILWRLWTEQPPPLSHLSWRLVPRSCDGYLSKTDLGLVPILSYRRRNGRPSAD